MKGSLLDTAPIRAVPLSETKCQDCGLRLGWVGVRYRQPQPDEGDYTICPNCYAIYQVGPNWTLLRPPERSIPLEILQLRDAAIIQLNDKARGDL